MTMNCIKCLSTRLRQFSLHHRYSNELLRRDYSKGHRKDVLPKWHDDDELVEGPRPEHEVIEDRFNDFYLNQRKNKNNQKEEIKTGGSLRKIISFKKLEREIEPKEKNLLTWTAKEQLRYLHKSFPEDWTVERLAESFPVSIQGVKKILRSKHEVTTQKELLKHDDKVKQNWEELKNVKGANRNPLDPTLNMLMEEKKFLTMVNATGIEHLPFPSVTEYPTEEELRKKLLDTYRGGKMGTFETYYRKYIQNSSEAKVDIQESSVPPCTLQDSLNEVSIVLQEEATRYCKQKDVEDGKRVKHRESDATGIDQNDLNVRHSYHENSDEELNNKKLIYTSMLKKDKKKGMKDKLLNKTSDQSFEFLTKITSGSVKDRPEKIVREDNQNRRRLLAKESHDDLQNLETSKSSRATSSKSFNVMNKHLLGQKYFSAREVEKYYNFDRDAVFSKDRLELEKDFTFEEVRVPEEDHMHKHQHNDRQNYQLPYVYDYEKGYQHPYGKLDKNEKKGQAQRYGDTKFTRKGNTVYDEEGEILFKIPHYTSED